MKVKLLIMQCSVRLFMYVTGAILHHYNYDITDIMSI